MKTKIIVSFTYLFFSISSLLAQLPKIINPSFESWSSQFNYEDLDSLLTQNVRLFYMGVPSNVVKETVAQHAMYAAKLNTILLNTDTVFGMILYGQPKPGGGGLIPNPYTRRPDSVVFYAKYNIQAGDLGNFILAFMVHDITCDTTIYVTHQFTGQNNNYTKYKYAIPWGATTCPPDSMTYLISSSRLDPPRSPGSTVTIDNMYFIEGSTTYFLPNGDFEHWTQNSSAEAPTGWATLNPYCTPGNISAAKSNDAIDGNYSLSLKTVTIISGDTLGYVGNGRFGNNGPEGGMFIPENVYIDSVTGFYKYIPIGSDTAIIGVLYKDAGIDTSRFLFLGATSSWTPFTIKIPFGVYDTLGIAFASSDLDRRANRINIRIGSELRIDSLKIHYRSFIGINENKKQEHIICYPNPAKDVVFITFPCNTQAKNIKISDIFGKEVSNYTISMIEGKTELNISHLPSGLYFVSSNMDKKLQGSFLIYR